jgi:hypothetical protein
VLQAQRRRRADEAAANDQDGFHFAAWIV